MKFKKEGGVKRVQDLKYIGEGDLQGFGITALTDRKRVMSMMQGEENAKCYSLYKVKLKPDLSSPTS